MRGFDCFRYFLAEFREELGDDAIPSESLPVFRFEELFSNDALGIDKKIPRPSKALLHARGFCIEDTIGLDGLRVRVRQQGVFDLVPVREEFQDFCRVVADGCQLDALLFESWRGALQLDQLPFAEGSPVSRPEKEKNGAVGSFEGVESLYAAKLVANRKSGSLLTDCKSNRHRLERSHLNCVAIQCALNGHRVSQACVDRCLRLKAVRDPVRIVIERQFRARNDLQALGGFGKGFVGVAAAGDKDAGPCSGICCGICRRTPWRISRVILPRHSEGDYGQEQY
jgi:hypothetical protein